MAAPDPAQSRLMEHVLPHLDAAYNLARWLTRDDHHAEDVVQEACERALRYHGSFRGGNSRPWFLAIVRHASYDWLKGNAMGQTISETELPLNEIVDDRAVDPEQSAIAGSERKTLAQALAELPVSFREVLILRELEEMSYRDIADVVGIPIGTVMSRLARARALLQHSPLLHAIRDQMGVGQR